MVVQSATFFEDAEAKKASGKKTGMYGAKTSGLICGDRLCSEIKKEAQVKITIKERVCPPEPSNIFLGNQTANDTAVNVPAVIPLHEAYHDKKFVYYILTESSDKDFADKTSADQCWKTQYSPILYNIDPSALSKVFTFSNGLLGNGILGYQPEVFSNTPEQPEEYSPLSLHYIVTWDRLQYAHTLTSEKEIFHSEHLGDLTISETLIVSNMQQVVWPGGQIPVKADKTISEETPHVGGQVIDIDLEELFVTYIAHKAFGPEGEPLYYIVSSVTPSDPAEALGVPYAQKLVNAFDSDATNDAFFFMNGIEGPGIMGYQTGIVEAAPGDPSYTPLWETNMIFWNSTAQARLLQTINNIESTNEDGSITIEIARPMGLDHVINAPLIEPYP